MKSIVFQPSTLSFALEERPIPGVGPGEVLIRVHAAALNRRDYHVMRNPASKGGAKFIFGSDGAGVIEAVGEGVTGWNIGDEVIANPGITCGTCEYCLRGQHTVCANFSTVGGGKYDGTFAEYVKFPAQYVEKKPAHLTFEQAAALPLALGTAWRSLISRAELRPGETLLIHGVGGGVALYGLQIAAKMGVRTIVTSGSDDKLARAKELGADVLINYRTDDVLQRVLEATDGAGVDVVLEGVGKDTLEISIAAAKKLGRIVYYGNNREWDEDRPMIWPSPIWFKNLNFMGAGMATPHEFAQAIAFVNATGLVPSVSEVLPLEEVGTAFERMKQYGQFGKIVLSVRG
jgi:zinc-binding alcohol dehydrogenase/oxidoreductase